MRTIFFALLSIFLCFSIPAIADLTYEGSSSIGGALLPELAKAFEQKSGIKFTTITSNDSTQGFKALMTGKTLIGGLSRLLTTEELNESLGNQVIGYDAIVIYLNSDNPVQNLTIEQLKKIFSNEITTWKEVGGKDEPIVTVLKKGGDEGGTTKQFRELVLAGQALATPSLFFNSHQENIEYVASNSTAVTFASLAFDEKVTKYVSINGVLPSREALNKGEYALARPYLLIYKAQPENEEIKKFLDFVFSGEGQNIVKKYVVPVMDSGR